MQNTIEPKPYLVITFDSTASAYSMEKSRRKDNLQGRLIPLPNTISAGCGAAFATENKDKEFWNDYMARNNIKHSAFYEIEL